MRCLGADLTRRPRWGLLLLCAAWTLGCEEELRPEEPKGAYLLWREALLQGDVDGVYKYLDQDTHKLLDERVTVLKELEGDISRYLPQVDQKIARKQTGAVLLRDHKDLEDGRALFGLIYQPGSLKITPEVRVGSEVSDVELNEAGDIASVVTYGGDQYYFKRESDSVWRTGAWLTLADERTRWVLDNQTALEQTVQDLISEEQEEIGAVIEHVLAEDKKRQQAPEGAKDAPK